MLGSKERAEVIVLRSEASTFTTIHLYQERSILQIRNVGQGSLTWPDLGGSYKVSSGSGGKDDISSLIVSVMTSLTVEEKESCILLLSLL